MKLVNQDYNWIPYNGEEKEKMKFLKMYVSEYLELYKDIKKNDFENSKTKDHGYMATLV